MIVGPVLPAVSSAFRHVAIPISSVPWLRTAWSWRTLPLLPGSRHQPHDEQREERRHAALRWFLALGRITSRMANDVRNVGTQLLWFIALGRIIGADPSHTRSRGAARPRTEHRLSCLCAHAREEPPVLGRSISIQ